MMYKFCPICSGHFNQSGHKLFVCQNCGFEFYLNPIPATGIILINKKNEILLTQRNIEPRKNLWCLPGGFTENNETAEQSAIRETKEETNITVNHLRYVCSVPNDYLYQNINLKMLDLYFTAELNQSHIKSIKPDKKETKKIKFFPLDQLPYSKMAFPGNVKAIKQYLSANKTNPIQKLIKNHSN